MAPPGRRLHWKEGGFRRLRNWPKTYRKRADMHSETNPNPTDCNTQWEWDERPLNIGAAACYTMDRSKTPVYWAIEVRVKQDSRRPREERLNRENAAIQYQSQSQGSFWWGSRHGNECASEWEAGEGSFSWTTNENLVKFVLRINNEKICRLVERADIPVRLSVVYHRSSVCLSDFLVAPFLIERKRKRPNDRSFNETQQRPNECIVKQISA